MRLVIFGLTVSSSWGNGHATLWRGLCRALGRDGHDVAFFERDVPYYAANRDLHELPGGQLHLYPSFAEVAPAARAAIREADAAIVTSYCPDGIAAADLVLSSPSVRKVFYDLDTPVTLANVRAGAPLAYIGPRGLCDFDLVLSYTGGSALEQLTTRLGARRVAPLYGSVDPDVHHPVPRGPAPRCDLSYLGTYAADRQEALHALFLEPARRLPAKRFLLGGALYPPDLRWTPNVTHRDHVAPGDHPAFFAASRLTLNVTRGAMAALGYCPSGRLFEAAACGVPILSDAWEGLDQFLTPGREILVARTTEDAVAALSLSEGDLGALARAARERTLAEHTAARRARELVSLLESTLHTGRSGAIEPRPAPGGG